MANHKITICNFCFEYFQNIYTIVDNLFDKTSFTYKTVLILSLIIHKLDKEICTLTERLPSNDIYIINAFNTKCNKW